MARVRTPEEQKAYVQGLETGIRTAIHEVRNSDITDAETYLNQTVNLLKETLGIVGSEE